MSPRKRLALSVFCGLLAAAAIALFLSEAEADARAARNDALARFGGERVTVYVALRDIAEGETITDDSFGKRQWLVDLLPQGVVTDVSLISGKRATSLIVENEPITQDRIGETGGTLSVPEGLCAVSVPSQDVFAVGGAVDPGSLVNVYARSDSGVVLLGEDVLVLETSSKSSEESEDSRGVLDSFGSTSQGAVSWVTLAVTAESVQELISASETNTLYLALPSSTCAQETGIEETTNVSTETTGGDAR